MFNRRLLGMSLSYALAFFALLFAFAGCEEAKEDKPIEKCPDTVKKAYEAPQAKRQIEDGKLTCNCPEEDGRGMVWGTGVYTDNSVICSAALHAGAIDASGGQVTLIESDGCDYYRASVRSGVPSRSWKDGDGSFYFDGHGEGVCGAECPPRLADHPNASPDMTMSCNCDPADIEGLAHGNGLYPQESSICTAAVHAGVIDGQSGGKVTLKGAPGCFGYLSTESNGIKTKRWGQSAVSFTFGPAPQCQLPCPVAWRFVGGHDENSEIECWCDGTDEGNVWGTGIYEPKSSICKAALHAGAIEPGTVGTVKVKGASGCEEVGYLGSTANNIKSLGESKGTKYAFYFPSAINLGEGEEVACPTSDDPSVKKLIDLGPSKKKRKGD